MSIATSNCNNCGAPLNPAGSCSHCGSGKIIPALIKKTAKLKDIAFNRSLALNSDSITQATRIAKLNRQIDLQNKVTAESLAAEIKKIDDAVESRARSEHEFYEHKISGNPYFEKAICKYYRQQGFVSMRITKGILVRWGAWRFFPANPYFYIVTGFIASMGVLAYYGNLDEHGMLKMLIFPILTYGLFIAFGIFACSKAED